MEVYFDNSATTKVLPSVADLVLKVMTEDYGNPSAKHGKGMRAEQYIKEAAEIIAGTLKVSPKEIIFTSGGSESNNMALTRTAIANKRAGNHIISTSIEHASVYNPLAYLEEQGFEVTYLPVDHDGHISLEDLENAIREDTILVSIMYVNNEIGAVEPVEEIAKRIKKKNPAILFHVDAIQAYGKFVIRPKRQGIDLLSVSGHKIHAPKGIGFLYVDSRVKIKPLIYGGGQERGLRSGTESLPMIAAFGAACAELSGKVPENLKRVQALSGMLREKLAAIEGVRITSPEDASPYILNISVPGYRSETMLHFLESRGVYVSSGSACSKGAASPVLGAMGLSPRLIDSALRVSMIYDTTQEELLQLVQGLREGISSVAHR